MDRAAWIDAFVMHLNRLGTNASPEVLVEVAECYFPRHGQSNPADIAQWHAEKFGLVREE